MTFVLGNEVMVLPIFDLEKSSLSEVPQSGNKEDKSKGVQKRKRKEKSKTEPANAYLQFIKAKKSALKAVNPGEIKICLNMTEANAEWKRLEDDQRAVYKEMFKKERTALGDDYRKNRKHKKKEVVTTKSEGKKQHQTKVRAPKAHKKEKPSFVAEISVVIKDLKDIELDIGGIEAEVNEMKRVKQSSAVELAVEKTKLKMKVENGVLLKEKLYNLQKIHKNCKIIN